MICEFCQSPVHIWFQCPKKPDGWKPARLATKDTPERASANVKSSPEVGPQAEASLAGTGTGMLVEREARPRGEAVSADLPTKFNKQEWQRLYMREHRKGLRRRKEGTK